MRRFCNWSSASEFVTTTNAATSAMETIFLFSGLLVLSELIFYISIHYHLLPCLQELTVPAVFPTDRVQYMKRVINLVHKLKCYTAQEYLSGFFRGELFENIHEENLFSFFAWTMFGKESWNLSDDQCCEISEIMNYAKQKEPQLSHLKPGFNPNVKHCCMTYEPIPIIHRPLIAYIVVALTEALANLFFLRFRGFQRLEVNGLTYWYRKGSRSAATETSNSATSEEMPSSTGEEPVVFLHGIATGWMLYLQLARAVSQGRTRTLILIDLDAVKVKSMTFTMPTPQQFVERFRKLLDRHHIPRASVVGHSFGSITAGWLATRCPDRVSHLTLLDPVSLLLCFPEVPFNFLYRSPVTLMQWLIHLVVAREITISHMLHRHFWWYNNTLWLEDVPAHIGVVVVLASGDEVLNAQAVQEFVRVCAAARRSQSVRMQQSAVNSAICGDSNAAADGHRHDETVALVSSKQHNHDVDGNGSKETHSVVARTADIECLMLDNFSHGQILFPSTQQAIMLAMIRKSENLHSTL